MQVGNRLARGQLETCDGGLRGAGARCATTAAATTTATRTLSTRAALAAADELDQFCFFFTQQTLCFRLCPLSAGSTCASAASPTSSSYGDTTGATSRSPATRRGGIG